MTKILLLSCCIFFPLLSQAQYGYDAQWHFGVGISVDFNSGEPIAGTSSIQTTFQVEPAVLCNGDGTLLSYADGNSIYNSSGNVIENGTFLDPAVENIFSPIPGSMDRFYLFRSGEGIGVTWSIVDMSLNDGYGGIAEEEKSISIGAFNSQLMTTSHANLFDRWLIVAHNNEGSGGMLDFVSFAITAEGLEETSSYSGSFTFATWYDNLEEARMSPSCVKIATSHKGHYITLFEFNNSSGEVSTGFENSVSLPDSFVTLNYIDFSPSGDYLYVLQDENSILRYDANTFNQIDFQNSEEMLFDYQGQASLSHIKRGPNDRMYLMNSTLMGLDEISGPDDLNPILTDTVIVFDEGISNFFPNTMNSCVSQPVLQVTDVCEGDSTYFYALFGQAPDSIYWVIQGLEQTDTIYSTFSFAQLNSPGEYPTEIYYLFDTLWVHLEDIAIVFEQPFVELGEDITACQGEEVQISVGETPFTVQWNTGETSPVINPEFSGTYSVSIVNGACVANDDIEVLFIQEPILDMPDIVICNEQVDVELSASGNWIDGFLWEDGSILPDTTVSSSGTYSVTVYNSCFSQEESATVTYVFFPESLVDSVYEVCAQDTLFVSTDYEPGNISWSNGDEGSITGITGEGEFTVEVEHLGCTTSDDFMVDRIPYIDTRDLIMPNVFTPNEDEFNEVFRPFVPDIPSLDPCAIETFSSILTIYNRWGNELFEGPCIWDGKTPGLDFVVDGSYFYLINLYSKCLDYESASQLNGSFEVLR